MPSLLVQGNTKVGPEVFCWSLPWVSTCPGATEACRAACYAKRFGRFRNLSSMYANNLEAAESPGFASEMVEEITRRDAKVVRIHVSGDFYSAAYVRKWVAIVKRLPGVAFYAYTRSFAVPRLLPALEALRGQPNVVLWWSTDLCTRGQVPEGRIAYMSMSDDDLPPEGVSMVFRVRRSTVKKRLGGVRVCPKESGSYPEGLTCGTCRLCFKRALVKG